MNQLTNWVSCILNALYLNLSDLNPGGSGGMSLPACIAGETASVAQPTAALGKELNMFTFHMSGTFFPKRTK